MTGSAARTSWNLPAALVAVLVLGYLSMTRTFAHIGVHPIYIGELSLVVFLLLPSVAVFGVWRDALRQGGPLGAFAWMLLISSAYGLAQLCRCLLAGGVSVGVLQNFVFHVYPLFFFVGVSVGARNPGYLAKLLKVLGWWICLYGVPYVLILGRITEREDLLTELPWFGQPCGGGSISILGLLTLSSGFVWPLVAMNSIVLLGVQSRAEWLSFSAALLLWGRLSGRLMQVLQVGAVVAAVLAVGYVTDFTIPSPSTRGGDFSTRSLIGRGIAAVSPDLAAELTDRADAYASTVSWRTEWWNNIWKEVHATPESTLVGLGYDYPIWDLHPEPLRTEVPPVRTPHSAIMFVLGYTGWFGLAIFYATMLMMGLLQFGVFRQTGQAFGTCLWFQIMIWSPFDPFFETPFAAIPVYLLLGLAAAPCVRGLAANDAVANSTEPALPSADHEGAPS